LYADVVFTLFYFLLRFFLTDTIAATLPVRLSEYIYLGIVLASFTFFYAFCCRFCHVGELGCLDDCVFLFVSCRCLAWLEGVRGGGVSLGLDGMVWRREKGCGEWGESYGIAIDRC